MKFDEGCNEFVFVDDWNIFDVDRVFKESSYYFATPTLAPTARILFLKYPV